MAADFEDYQAGRFISTANTPLGRMLWAHHWSRCRASDESLPPISARCRRIEEELLDKFGDAVLPDRIKQMIGHMVRQVRDREGFVVDQNHVKLNSVPFSKGTRYRRPDWYAVHFFRSSTDPRDLCFTDSGTGDKLPAPPNVASDDTGHPSLQAFAVPSRSD